MSVLDRLQPLSTVASEEIEHVHFRFIYFVNWFSSIKGMFFVDIVDCLDRQGIQYLTRNAEYQRFGGTNLTHLLD